MDLIDFATVALSCLAVVCGLLLVALAAPPHRQAPPARRGDCSGRFWETIEPQQARLAFREFAAERQMGSYAEAKEDHDGSSGDLLGFDSLLLAEMDCGVSNELDLGVSRRAPPGDLRGRREVRVCVTDVACLAIDSLRVPIGLPARAVCGRTTDGAADGDTSGSKLRIRGGATATVPTAGDDGTSNGGQASQRHCGRLGDSTR